MGEAEPALTRVVRTGRNRGVELDWRQYGCREQLMRGKSGHKGSTSLHAGMRPDVKESGSAGGSCLNSFSQAGGSCEKEGNGGSQGPGEEWALGTGRAFATFMAESWIIGGPDSFTLSIPNMKI